MGQKRATKKSKIIKLLKEGYAVSDIVKSLGCSYDYVRRISLEFKADNKTDNKLKNICKLCKQNDKGSNRWYCDFCLRNRISKYGGYSWYDGTAIPELGENKRGKI